MNVPSSRFGTRRSVCGRFCVLSVALFVSSCAPRARESAPPHAPTEAGAAPPAALEPGQPAPARAATDGAVPATPDASGAPSPGTPAVAPVPSGPERHGPPLPELRVKSFGLHVGGGSKDGEARAEYLSLLESGSWRYLDCYRLIESPGSEGTFGADLHVPGGGGPGRVERARTKLKGEEFRACMAEAFESVTFPRTPSGRAVVVSYSVKFSLAF